MILLQHCLNAEPPSEELRYYPLFCDMRTGNWGHGKPQAVPTSLFLNRDPYLQNDYSRNAQTGKQLNMDAHIQLCVEYPPVLTGFEHVTLGPIGKHVTNVKPISALGYIIKLFVIINTQYLTYSI